MEQHDRDSRTPEFDNAAALKAHCAQYPNAWFSQAAVYIPMPPGLDEVHEQAVDASRLPSVAPEPSSDVEMADAESEVRAHCSLKHFQVADYFHAVRVHRSDG